jgi:hypothetical protein
MNKNGGILIKINYYTKVLHFLKAGYDKKHFLKESQFINFGYTHTIKAMKRIWSAARLVLLALGFLFLISCEKESPEKAHPLSIDKLSGLVQKGPFLNGTSITVAELKSDMGQTGKNFRNQR